MKGLNDFHNKTFLLGDRKKWKRKNINKSEAPKLMHCHVFAPKGGHY